MWDIYKFNSGVLPVTSRHILRINFCLPTVPIPGLGCPPAGSSPCPEKEEWLSLQLWLPLLVPVSLHLAALHPGVLGASQLLFLPSSFAAQGCLPHSGLHNTAASAVEGWPALMCGFSMPALGTDAALLSGGKGAKDWVCGILVFLWKVQNMCCQLLCATVSSCRGEPVCSSMLEVGFRG